MMLDCGDIILVRGTVTFESANNESEQVVVHEGEKFSILSLTARGWAKAVMCEPNDRRPPFYIKDNLQLQHCLIKIKTPLVQLRCSGERFEYNPRIAVFWRRRPRPTLDWTPELEEANKLFMGVTHDLG
jgi:hypothetical protein